MTTMLDRMRRRPQGSAPDPYDPHADLRSRRDELAERVAELTWDLGGLTYEMAIRDHRWLKIPLCRLSQLFLGLLFRSATKEKIQYWSPHLWACLQK